jgi:hypothetical protein
MLSWPANQELLDRRRLRFYRGCSMTGTFRPGDCLTVAPVGLAAVRRGDVVVFRGHACEAEADAIVHRVMGVLRDGLVTQGDNNACPDNTPVTAERLVGRATHLTRGGKTQRVAGGWSGWLHARTIRGRRRLWRIVRRLGRRPYAWLRASRLAPRFWRPTIQTIRRESTSGLLIKYVSRGRTVACWWPQTNRFECSKPYDLILGPKTQDRS